MFYFFSRKNAFQEFHNHNLNIVIFCIFRLKKNTMIKTAIIYTICDLCLNKFFNKISDSTIHIEADKFPSIDEIRLGLRKYLLTKGSAKISDSPTDIYFMTIGAMNAMSLLNEGHLSPRIFGFVYDTIAVIVSSSLAQIKGGSK